MADIRFKERYIGFVFKNFKNPDSYLDYGSFNLGYCEGLDEEFADLTFRFNFSGKLMPDFWHAKDGFHQLSEDEPFYKSLQQALVEILDEDCDRDSSKFHEIITGLRPFDIEILTQADYFHYGSLKIVGFDNVIFRFDISGKLMPDYLNNTSGVYPLLLKYEHGHFYKKMQNKLNFTLAHIQKTCGVSNQADRENGQDDENKL